MIQRMSTSSLPSISSVFTSADSLVKSRLWSCGTCESSFLSQMELVQHEEQEHSKSSYQTFHCPICRAMFSDQSLLADHLLKFHSSLRPECFSSNHHCPSCKTEFNTLESLIQHMRGGCANKQASQQSEKDMTAEKAVFADQLPISAGSVTKEKNLPDIYAALLNSALEGIKSSLAQNKVAGDDRLIQLSTIQHLVQASVGQNLMSRNQNQVQMKAAQDHVQSGLGCSNLSDNQNLTQMTTTQNVFPTNQVSHELPRNMSQFQLNNSIGRKQGVKSEKEFKNTTQTNGEDKCLQKTWRLPKKRKNPDGVVSSSKTRNLIQNRLPQNVTNIRQSARKGNVWDQAHMLGGNCLQLTWKLPKRGRREGSDKKLLNYKKNMAPQNLLQPVLNFERTATHVQTYSQENADMIGNQRSEMSAPAGSGFQYTDVVPTKQLPGNLPQLSVQALSQGFSWDTSSINQIKEGQNSVTTILAKPHNSEGNALETRISAGFMLPMTNKNISPASKNAPCTVNGYQQTVVSQAQDVSNGCMVPETQQKDMATPSYTGGNNLTNGACVGNSYSANVIASSDMIQQASLVKDSTLKNASSLHTQHDSRHLPGSLSKTQNTLTSGSPLYNEDVLASPIACAFCDSVYNDLNLLYEHEQLHEKLGTLMCKECGLCATSLFDMYKHVGSNRKCPDDNDDETTLESDSCPVSNASVSVAPAVHCEVKTSSEFVKEVIGSSAVNMIKSHNQKEIEKSESQVSSYRSHSSNCEMTVEEIKHCYQGIRAIDVHVSSEKSHLAGEGQPEDQSQLKSVDTCGLHNSAVQEESESVDTGGLHNSVVQNESKLVDTNGLESPALQKQFESVGTDGLQSSDVQEDGEEGLHLRLECSDTED